MSTRTTRKRKSTSNENQETKRTKISKNSNNDNKDDVIRQLKHDNEQLTLELKEAKDEILALKRKLETHEELTQLRVSIARGDGLYTDAANEFLDQVKEKLLEQNIELLLTEQSEKDSDESETPLLLVFCLNTSRLGSDVDATYRKKLKNFQTGSALVIMHHKPKHLTKVTPSESLLVAATKERFSIEDVMDCIFWTSQGLHDCVTNSQAVKKLVMYLRKKTLK